MRKQHGELLDTNVRGLISDVSAAVKELARRIGEPVT